MSIPKQENWFSIMGLSKIFLRNFVVASVALLIITISTLATLLNQINQERLRDEKLFRNEIIQLTKKCQDASEEKNKEFIKLLEEAIRHQAKIDQELKNWSKTSK
jgi:DNA-binding protein H-NS